MAVNLLYASLFVADVYSLALDNLPPNQRSGPDYLNVSRILDLPQVLALSAERNRVLLTSKVPGLSLTFPQGVLRLIGREQELMAEP
jgi:hypothetical protein